jgi:hypothetical protein
MADPICVPRNGEEAQRAGKKDTKVQEVPVSAQALNDEATAGCYKANRFLQDQSEDRSDYSDLVTME